ncbi:hypothetical protein ACTQ29_00905 [Bifidobacterium boum]|uniref:hypothetical protein n=1 Tax=Bifidobacterium boum TaxID=78343 RepID=UPI003F8F6C4A
MVYEFDGIKCERLRDMRAVRRVKCLGLVRGGMDFTRAARAVGVSKRTGTVWRNGRTRSAGRNGRPLVDRCRGGMDRPGRIDAGCLCMDGRIAIARALGRAPGTISRGPRRNADDIGGAYGPHRVRQTATHRPRHPKPRVLRCPMESGRHEIGASGQTYERP